MNDAGGYTNGFYYGNINLMIKLLKRYEDIINMKYAYKADYEFYVKHVMDINKIVRGNCITMYFKIKKFFMHIGHPIKIKYLESCYHNLKYNFDDFVK